MSVQDVSREVYRELQESGYLGLMQLQNLIWIHEYYVDFGDWPTTGELMDWINKEQSATILDDVGRDHIEIGVNQIRPRVTDDLHGDKELLEKLDQREQDGKRKREAHPYRILYDRVEQELGIDLRSEESEQDGDDDLDIRKVGDHYEDQYGNKYLFDPTKDPQEDVDGSDSNSIEKIEDADSEEDEDQEDEEEDDDSNQTLLMEDGEVVP